MNYGPIVMKLHRAGFAFQDRAKAFEKQKFKLKTQLVPRAHQSSALEAWRKVSCRGMVVLPTGTGKSFLAHGNSTLSATILDHGSNY